MAKTFKVTTWGEEFEIEVDTTKYSANGNTAVMLNTVDGEAFAMLSVNTDVALPDNHFYLKDYSENEQIVANPAVQELYTPCEVHGQVSSGFVTLSCHILKA